MSLFRYCTNSIHWLLLRWRDNHNGAAAVASESTPLRHDRGATVVYPLAHKDGFSLGFVSFFDSSAGIMFALLNLAIYYASAVIAFSFTLEKWTIIDSLYFATITFTSVGYGDITPDTDGGRIFTFFFGLYGIFILGFLAGIVGEKIVELHNTAVKAAEERVRKQVTNMFEHADHRHHKQHHEDSHPEKTPATIIWRLIKLEFPLISSVILIGVLYGTVVEGWTVIQSIYFAGCTASTVGYGDFTPQEQWTRLLAVIVIPLSVVIFCEVLGRIAGAYLDYKMVLQEKKFLDQQITLSDLDNMDTNRDGEVEWGEFLAFMLTALQKVDEADIRKLRKLFDKLDANGTGKLDKMDILDARRQNPQKEIS